MNFPHCVVVADSSFEVETFVCCFATVDGNSVGFRILVFVVDFDDFEKSFGFFHPYY